MGKQRADGITWCDYTLNLWRGCWKISPGCEHCYAEVMDHRFDHGNWGRTAPRFTFREAHYRQPFAWNAAAEKAGVRRKVFVGSVMDIAEIHALQDVADMQSIFRQSFFETVKATPWLDYLLLTKRPENLRWILPWIGRDEEAPSNVWLGVSAENQKYADERIPLLRGVRAEKYFVSYEPALGPINFTGHLDTAEQRGWIDMVIFGDESGRNRRPAELEWARQTRDQCERAGVTFHFKQFQKVHLPVLDGRQHAEMPE